MTCLSFDQGVRQAHKLDYISVPVKVVLKQQRNADGNEFNEFDVSSESPSSESK